MHARRLFCIAEVLHAERFTRKALSQKDLNTFFIYDLYFRERKDDGKRENNIGKYKSW